MLFQFICVEGRPCEEPFFPRLLKALEIQLPDEGASRSSGSVHRDPQMTQVLQSSSKFRIGVEPVQRMWNRVCLRVVNRYTLEDLDKHKDICLISCRSELVN